MSVARLFVSRAHALRGLFGRLLRALLICSVAGTSFASSVTASLDSQLSQQISQAATDTLVTTPIATNTESANTTPTAGASETETTLPTGTTTPTTFETPAIDPSEIITPVATVAASATTHSLATETPMAHASPTATTSSPLPTATPVGPAPDLHDLVPSGLSVVMAVPDPIRGGEVVAATQGGAAFSFLNSQVLLIVPDGTFPTVVELRMRSASVVSVTQEVISTTAGIEVLPVDIDDAPIRFELEAVNVANGETVADFDKAVTLALDLRRLSAKPTHRSWYIAYRESQAGTVWHQAPVIVHDSTGLISTETTHFSEWIAAPDSSRWRFRWEPPVASVFSGATSYSYPIEIPPGRGGLTPSINVSYSSRGVDSLTRSTVDQGVLGLGWQFDSVEISRNGTFMWDDSAHLRWQVPHRFSIALNGESHELFTTGSAVANTVRYYAKNAPQLFVQRIYDPNATGINPDKIYWTVKTSDGTTYRLGYTPDAESGQEAWFTDTLPEENPGARADYTGVRWRVDTVTDVTGNQIQYGYAILTNNIDHYQTSHNPPHEMDVITGLRRIASIRYNFQNLAANPSDRRPQSEAQTWIDFIGNGDNKRVEEIRLYHVNMGAPYRIIDFTLGSTTYSDGFGDTTTEKVLAIQELSGDRTQTLPATTFSYVALPHVYSDRRVYDYVQQIDNGYGARTRFTYSSDNRNTSDEVGASWFVTQIDTWDNFSGGAPNHQSTTTYGYTAPCYDQEEGQVGNLNGAFMCPTHTNYQGLIQNYKYSNGPLVGFSTTTVTHLGYEGEFLDRSVTYFHQDMLKMGKAYRQQSLDPSNGVVLRAVETVYATMGMTATTFIVTSVVTNTTISGGFSLTNVSKFFYNTADQGGAQYGNLTQIEDYDTPNHLARCTKRTYYPNTTQWIVSKLASEVVYSPCTSNLSDAVSLVSYVYNTSAAPSSSAPPDNLGLLRVVRRWNGNPTNAEYVDTRYGYDAWGNPQTQTTYGNYGTASTYASDTPLTTTATYDGQLHLYLTSITPPISALAVTYHYYGIDGVASSGYPAGSLKQQTDANGQVTSYTYDSLGRLVDTYLPGDGAGDPSVRFTYAFPGGQPNPFMIEEWHKPLSMPTASVRHFYDGLGREIQTHTARSVTLSGQTGSKDILVTVVYDALGRIISQTVPYATTAYYSALRPSPYLATIPSGTGSTTTLYDVLGRVTTVTLPDGTLTQSTYGLDSTAQYGITQTTGLLLQSTIDANGDMRQQITDAFGHMVAVREFTGNTPATYSLYATTRYGYDPLDRLVAVTDTLSAVTTIAYNALGQKIHMDDPDMGSWSYKYNAAGNLTAQVDARGQAVNFYYDAINRLIGKTYSSGITDAAAYIPPADPGYPGYEIKQYYDSSAGGNLGIGRRTSVVDESGTASWVYDARGRVSQETRVVTDAGTHTTLFGYDALDRPTSTTLPTGEVVTQTYNAQGLVADVRSQTHNAWYVSSLTYDASSRTELVAYGNGLQTDFTYYPWTTPNGMGRLSKIETGSAQYPQELQYLSYGYKPDGNIASISDFAQNLPQAILSTGTGFGSTYVSGRVEGGQTRGRTWVDASGDGKADYCTLLGTIAFQSSRIACTLSTGTGFGATYQSGIVQWGYDAGRAWADFSGDGKADFCRVIGSVNLTSSYVSCTLSTGTAFGSTYTSGVIDWGNNDGRAWVDFNGDGKADYCRVVGSVNNQSSYVSCTVSTGTGFGTTYTSGVIDWGQNVGRHWTDFNGDGKADYCRLIGATNPGSIACTLSTGTGFGATYTSGSLDRGQDAARAWTDFNGDAKADFCRLVGSGSSAAVACTLSTGIGFSTTYTSTTLDWGHTDGRAWADFNGDGNSDFCRVIGTVNRQTSNVTCTLSTGTGWGATHTSGVINWGQNTGRAWADFDGDNKADFLSLMDTVQWYSYDRLDRVTSSATSGGYTAFYSYGPTGNMLSKTEGGPAVTYTYPAATSSHPHAVTALSNGSKFAYDANGNMITRTTLVAGQLVTYTQAWDGENRLEVVTDTTTNRTTTFVYDADGARVKMVEQLGAALTTTVYLGSVELILGASPLTRTHYHAGALLVAVRETRPASDKLYFLAGDHLGSTSVVTCGNSACGAVSDLVARQYYYPYGSVRPVGVGALPTAHTFTGQVADGTGLMYYRARYYDPAVSAFVSADSLVPAPGNPQTLNRYAYALSNPLRYTDPTGHYVCVAGSATTAITTSQCQTWVEQMLMDIENSGATGADLVAYFREHDALYSALDGRGFHIVFIDGIGGGAAPPFIVGVVMDISYLKVSPGTQSWYESAGLFGHELKHLQQSVDLRMSSQGEAIAYKTQAQLLDDFNSSYGLNIEKSTILQDALAMDVNDVKQVEAFRREHLVPTGIWIYKTEPTIGPAKRLQTFINSLLRPRKPGARRIAP